MRTVLSIFGIDPKRIGGTEYFARELSTQLHSNGCRSVLLFGHDPTPAVRQFLSSENVDIEVVPEVWKADATICGQVAGLVRHHRPDIVHLHFIRFVSPLPFVARAIARCPVFFSDHSSHPAGFQIARRPFWKRLLVRVGTFPVTHVISVSGYGQRVMKGSGYVPDSRSFLIYNGVDCTPRPDVSHNGEGFRRRFGIPAERVMVLQVSWLIDEKGIPDLLEAARKALGENPRLHFVFAGEGPEGARYEAYARRLGIAGAVTWAGLIADPLGEGLYDAADIVCQVSRWQEVFGWVIAEAMLRAKPVVATRVGGIPEVVDDGATGRLVAPGDPDAIAKAILELAADRALRENLGSAGRQRCLERFDLRENVRKTIALYISALNRA